MAEWFKASRLKRDSRKVGRGFGDPARGRGGAESEASEHILLPSPCITLVISNEFGVQSSEPQIFFKALINGYSELRAKNSGLMFETEGWPSGLRRRS